MQSLGTSSTFQLVAGWRFQGEESTPVPPAKIFFSPVSWRLGSKRKLLAPSVPP